MAKRSVESGARVGPGLTRTSIWPTQSSKVLFCSSLPDAQETCLTSVEGTLSCTFRTGREPELVVLLHDCYTAIKPTRVTHGREQRIRQKATTWIIHAGIQPWLSCKS
jgi:hypothetical protein